MLAADRLPTCRPRHYQPLASASSSKPSSPASPSSSPPPSPPPSFSPSPPPVLPLKPRRPSPAARAITALLAVTALILFGTAVILGTVWAHFHTDKQALLTPAELTLVDPSFTWTDPRLASPQSQPELAARRPTRRGDPAAAPAHELNWQRNFPHIAQLFHMRSLWARAPVPGPEPQPRPDLGPAPAPAPGSGPQHATPPVDSSAEESQAPVYSASRYFGHFAPGQYNGTRPRRAGEQIPRLIHQTWKSASIPAKWQGNAAGCRAMHPDYDYILWTDADARAFIAAEYPWFLPTFDAYPYPIERADAIRYFVLHRYGGVYMDLDMGCVRPMDPLLHFEVVLPQTKPVGVSNDLMLSVPGHPFLTHAIRVISQWNKNYLVPYATVMFSTGPMFISGAYGQYVRTHAPVLPSAPDAPRRGTKGVRILPQILYGKLQNPPPGLHIQPGAFYSHYYGSSWHAGDANFIKLLGNCGWLVVGFAICLFGYWGWRTYRPACAGASGPRRASISGVFPFTIHKSHLALAPPALARTRSSLGSYVGSSAALAPGAGAGDGWATEAEGDAETEMDMEWDRDEPLDAVDLETLGATRTATEKRDSEELGAAYAYARACNANALSASMTVVPAPRDHLDLDQEPEKA